MTAQRVERKRREVRGGGIPGWVLALVGLVIGLALGLAYAWLIDPIEYTNANPGDLAPGGKSAWVQMVADSYALTDDAQEVQRRLQFFEPDELQLLLGNLLVSAEQAGDLPRVQRLRQLADLADTEPVVAPEPAPEPVAEGSPIGSLLMACGVGLLALVLFGAIAVVVTRLRQDRAAGARQVRPVTARGRVGAGLPPVMESSEEAEPSRFTRGPESVEEGGALIVDAPEEEEELDDREPEDLFSETAIPLAEVAEEPARRVGFAEPEETPAQYSPALAEFVTRYNYGDDGYDISFPIETAQTEFLGETGVGISEVLNDGSPQQVTAFEVWLFDKDDIRTVTKVLLSDYAWDDEELRSRLAPKGELVQVEEGNTIDLETKSLRVRARIREADYGKNGAGPYSYFDRFVVELTAQQKQ
ncbi:MAG: hypothetical protein M3220_04075 [Chloroflexota bacterium]|nr:hypothetical protein [Chloroflexota bacterium]